MRKLMSLSKLGKSSSFLELTPDSQIPTPNDAIVNADNITHTPRILTKGAFSYVIPEKRPRYQFLTASPQAVADLGIESLDMHTKEFQDIVSGQIYHHPDFGQTYPMPYSQAYAGWQFGQFAGQLGDGRVVNMFEVAKVRSAYDEHFHSVVDKFNRSKYELQLKGAGLTPYSRFADGKAVLRSSVREYIISEHLNAIGIPTTRALALTLLPETRARRHSPETCAIVTRFSELWVRLGTFDLYRWRNDRSGIKQLSDYVIRHLFTVNEKFPYFHQFVNKNPGYFDMELTDYDKMYFEIVLRNATNIAKWQTYGFLNGVLNTDNTSVLGLSMDYGPFSIMDRFDPDYTPNSEDLQKRYGYKNTPTAAWWNLTRLGEDLAELIGDAPEQNSSQPMTPELEAKIIQRATRIIELAGEIYMKAFTASYVESFFQRLGLSPRLIEDDAEVTNQEIIAPLLQMLRKIKCDYNMFFSALSRQQFDSNSINYQEVARAIEVDNDLYEDQELYDMIVEWLKIYIPYLKRSESLGFERASSAKFNPLFLPRNWILDEVIEKTETGDLRYLHKLEKMSFHPFDKAMWGNDLKEIESRWVKQGNMGERYSMLQCSCSS